MIYYHLSSRQLASIEDGETLSIALPVTFDTPDPNNAAELRQWYLDAIHDGDRLQVHNLRAERVWCHLTNRGSSMTGDPEAMTLGNRVGEMVDARHRDKLPCYPVQCIVAEIGGKLSNKPPRWPGGKLVYVKHVADT